MARTFNTGPLSSAARDYAAYGASGLKSRRFPDDMVPRDKRGPELQAALRQMPNFRNLPTSTNIPAMLTPYEKLNRELGSKLRSR